MNKGTVKPEPQIKQTYEIIHQDIGDVYDNYKHHKEHSIRLIQKFDLV